MSNNKKYDFVIVGAGFAGATCARLLTDKGYRCLIIEERPFVSGNCVTDRRNNIDVHFFGGHIIHTNNPQVWRFLNTYGEIHQWRYPGYAWNRGRMFRIPLGMDLINDLYDVTWPNEAYKELDKRLVEKDECKTIEDYALKYFGKDVYELTIKEFYKQMFDMPCNEISYHAMLERRDDNSFIYRDSLYPEMYQGVPEEGFTKLVENIIGDDIDIMLNTNFLENKEKYINLAHYTIYTAELDKFFNYCVGELDWVSAIFSFNDDSQNTNNVSGVPIVRFCDNSIEWYRMTEHKWLTPWRWNLDIDERFRKTTFVTYECYKKWERGDECIYPIYNEKSLNLYSRYLDRLHREYPSVLLCGRKAKYNYAHICDVIEDAMTLVDKFPEK